MLNRNVNGLSDCQPSRALFCNSKFSNCARASVNADWVWSFYLFGCIMYAVHFLHCNNAPDTLFTVSVEQFNIVFIITQQTGNKSVTYGVPWLTIYVRYDILGKLELTTDLKATAVRTSVNASWSLFSGLPLSTANVANAKLQMRNWNKKSNQINTVNDIIIHLLTMYVR